jgi:non-homologous end joining protein Ku
LIYDPEQRATTRTLMAHKYFQEDGFPDRFEESLKQLIEMEKEKELADRAKRKRTKRVMSFCLKASILMACVEHQKRAQAKMQKTRKNSGNY